MFLRNTVLLSLAPRILGSTSSELRLRIETHWNEILHRLHVPPSNKEATLAEKILYVLCRLKEDRRAQDPDHQLVTAVCEVVAEGCKQEVMHMIKEVEHKVHVPTMVIIWVHAPSWNGVTQHDIITESISCICS